MSVHLRESLGWAWCSEVRTSREDVPASSFLFLRPQEEFRVAEDWADDSEYLEGRQFWCHAVCFQDPMGPVARRAVFDPDF